MVYFSVTDSHDENHLGWGGHGGGRQTSPWRSATLHCTPHSPPLSHLMTFITLIWVCLHWTKGLRKRMGTISIEVCHHDCKDEKSELLQELVYDWYRFWLIVTNGSGVWGPIHTKQKRTHKRCRYHLQSYSHLSPVHLNAKGTSLQNGYKYFNAGRVHIFHYFEANSITLLCLTIPWSFSGRSNYTVAST